MSPAVHYEPGDKFTFDAGRSLLPASVADMVRSFTEVLKETARQSAMTFDAFKAFDAIMIEQAALLTDKLRVSPEESEEAWDSKAAILQREKEANRLRFILPPKKAGIGRALAQLVGLVLPRRNRQRHSLQKIG